jgi:hypothetical protein
MIIKSGEILPCKKDGQLPVEGVFGDEFGEFDYYKCPECGHMETGNPGSGEARRNWNAWADKDSLENTIEKFLKLYGFDLREKYKLLERG